MNVYAKARDSPDTRMMVIAAHKQYHIIKKRYRNDGANPSKQKL